MGLPSGLFVRCRAQLSHARGPASPSAMRLLMQAGGHSPGTAASFAITSDQSSTPTGDASTQHAATPRAATTGSGAKAWPLRDRGEQ